MTGVDLRSRAADLLDEVADGEVEGFYAYRIAETVPRLGRIALPAERVRNVIAATRSPRLVADSLRPRRSAGGIFLSWGRGAFGR